MVYLLNHHKWCMRSSHGRLRLCLDISSESMEAIICSTSGIEPVRVLEWEMTLLSGWNWLELMLKAGDGGKGGENTEFLHNWCFCAFCFPGFSFFPLSLPSSWKTNQSLYLCFAETDAMKGETSDLGVRGNVLESKREGNLSCFGCVKIQGNNQKQWPLHWSWLWPLWSTHRTQMVPMGFGDAMGPFGF